MRTAPSRPIAGWQADHFMEREERVARVAGAVGVEEPARLPRLSGIGQLVGVLDRRLCVGPGRARDTAAGSGWKATAETVEQNRGPSIDDRKRVTPEAKSQPEPEVCGGCRVRSLSRQVRRRVRHADADQCRDASRAVPTWRRDPSAGPRRGRPRAGRRTPRASRARSAAVGERRGGRPLEQFKEAAERESSRPARLPPGRGDSRAERRPAPVCPA